MPPAQSKRDVFTAHGPTAPPSQNFIMLVNMWLWYLLFPAYMPSQMVAGSAIFQRKCLAFQPANHIDSATLNVLQFVAAGTTIALPDNDATCNRASQTVSADLCRIALTIRTSNSSSIVFEAWFPENWSGRFLATGNGGIDGCKSQAGALSCSLPGLGVMA